MSSRDRATELLEPMLNGSGVELRMAVVSSLGLLWWETADRAITDLLVGAYEQIEVSDRPSLDSSVIVAAALGVRGGNEHLVAEADLVRNPPSPKRLGASL